MSWIEDIISPKTRQWEEFYRNRWQHDKVVRSTHGVNCTGGCSWNVYVKEGIVVWETQALDYPLLESSLPPYEPRGCQRGISYSWYLYSPIRIKYPLVRGAMLDLFKIEKKRLGGDAFKAWESLQTDPSKRKRYQNARGKGGFRRVRWEEAVEIIAAANLYTIKKYGPDRVIGFSPIPAMSMLSYASGARYLQLLGGVNLSFYDWYCDLPTAFPEIWGEQTDVCESADWYNSKFCVSMGANLGMTRTPDIHFFSESKHNGTKTVVMSPDFSMVAKHADQWIPCHAGQDGAFWMSVTHVILKEYHADRQVPYFIDYVKRYTDCPYLVELIEQNGQWVPGKFVRANRLSKYDNIENGDWKFLNIDSNTGDAVMPKGSMGHRWDKNGGKWNLKYEDGEFDTDYNPELTFIQQHDEVIHVQFTEFGIKKNYLRGLPVRKLQTKSGAIPVVTVYDLIMGQYGVKRGLPGDYPNSYEDAGHSYTPAWQEKFTGIGKETVLQFAREWGSTAEVTKGKCMVIVGAAINHWYHHNLMYRSSIMTQMLTGCNGVNGGGMNHYVGQEKLAPMDSWSTIMSGKDWQGAVRLQQGPIWHYINSDQWRYDNNQIDYNTVPEYSTLGKLHSADWVAMSVRNGWMPFYPQYNRNTLELAKDAMKQGAESDDAIRDYVVDQLKRKQLNYSVMDPDHEDNYPRNWFIWRGNALMSSAKGHEYMLDHYLGTHTNKIADEVAQPLVHELLWREAPKGKMDLVVDINFRMDTSALYSDIVLPTASWYEKSDINSTDMHSFIHPLSPAVAPVWESKSDWQIFQYIAKVFSDLALKHLPEPVKDIVNVPLSHDSADEITQPKLQDWYKGDCEPIPGKTMHKIVIVPRDYTQIYNKFISLGQNIKKSPIGAHGVNFMADDVYAEMLQDKRHVQRIDQVEYPSLKEDVEAINAILSLSSLTNGAMTVRAYTNMEKKTGMPLLQHGQGYQSVRLDYKDLQSQPRRYNNSPLWSGLMDNGRAYCAYTYNVDCLVPWRTLTGRQSFYLDHDGYIEFGEHLPTYKPSPTPQAYGDLRKTVNDGKAKMLNVLTPHGKWHIHSTYGDTLRMLTLSRGMEPCWLSEEDAAELGIKDNDWVEVYNDHGVYCTRACVSARIPKGICIVYHSPERTYSVPLSQERGRKRAGGHNSFTRVHLKPNLMVGGYGQFTYHFNYWGPVGVNRDTHVLVRKMEILEF
ncbi:MAG: nitrate reductase subunit alpha [Chitinophagaceae bacterium]|nr:nitrate reductase subunit alpha [Chitinophagaceae bacterium]